MFCTGTPESLPCRGALPPAPLANGSQSNWTVAQLPGSPPARFDAAFGFDVQGGDFVLFGGETCTVSLCSWLNDTWTYNGSAWTEVSPRISPAARLGAMMTYDARDRALLLFGGWGGTVPYGASLNDTWEYRSGNWTEVNDGNRSSPPPTYSGALAYDPTSGKAVLFGGCCGGIGIFDISTTWTFEAGNWSEVNSALSPDARDGAGIFFDPSDGGLILVGGIYCNDQDCIDFQDTWLFQNSSWIELSPLTAPGLETYSPVVYDSSLRAGLLVDIIGRTWLFVNDQWGLASTGVLTSPAIGASAAFQDPDGPVVLFGGGSGWIFSSPTSVSNETSTLRGVPEAPFRAYATATPTVLDVGQTLRVTGVAGGGSWRYSFLYSGLPPGCSSVDAAIVSCAPNLPGSFLVNATIADSGGNSSSSLLRLVVSSAPSILLTANRTRLDQGDPTLLTTNITGGTPPTTVSWFGMPPGDCQAISDASGICHPPTGLWTIGAKVCDAVWSCVTSSPVDLVVNPTLNVTLFALIDTGSGVFHAQFLATLAGGTAPFSFAWAFGDGAAVATDVPWAFHNYSAPGPWNATVVLSDAVVDSRMIGTTVFFPTQPYSLAPDVSLTATPSRLDLGQATTFAAKVTNGTPPFGHAWFGLPPGCSGDAAPTLTCRPSAPGMFEVVLEVTDHDGRTAWAGAPLTVQPELTVAVSGTSVSDCTTAAVESRLIALVSGGDPPYAFAWIPGDGSNGTSNDTLVHSYAFSPSLYLGNVTVTDSLGSSVSSQYSIAASPPTCTISGTIGPERAASPPFPLELLAAVGGIAAGIGVVAGWLLSRRALRPKSR